MSTVPPGTRFRTDYRQQAYTGDDGIEKITITYPASLGFDILGSFAFTGSAGAETVGTVITHPLGAPHAYGADREDLGTHPTPEKAIVVVIEHDQAKHNTKQ